MGLCTTMTKPKPVANTIDMYVDSKAINEKLLQLSMKTGYSCIQRNGQRYYGPPPNWLGPPPTRGSEVFIGRIPRDCFEDEMVPFLTKVAPIYEMRMMMNFTGSNRGFAFATFFNPQVAWKAVMELNGTEIRPGHKVGVFKSIDNCRLYMGGIPLDKTKEETWNELMKVCPTVKDIILYPNPKDRTRNRGFLFIEFDSHRSAAMGKRNMAPGSVKLWGKEVIVEWALPEPDVDPKTMAQVKKLFLRSFSSAFTKERIKRLLLEVVPPSYVQRVYISGHYGFVHFQTREHAQLAKDKLSNAYLEGEVLEVQWARPKCFRKNSAITKCKSVPPRFRHEEEEDASSEGLEAEQRNQMPVFVPPHMGSVAPLMMTNHPYMGSATPHMGTSPPLMGSAPAPLALPPAEVFCSYKCVEDAPPPHYPYPLPPQPYLVYTHSHLSYIAP